MKHIQNTLAIILICLLSGNIFSSCNTVHGTEQSAQTMANIPYPQPRPDSTALTFLPGIVSTDSVEFDETFAPDGKSFFFTRTENKKWKIYVSYNDGTNWTKPVVAPFTETKYSQADPAFSPDGKLYYISNRPKTKSDTSTDYDIWFVTPLGNGKWSAPENLKAINTKSDEYYMSFAKNGNLYFASSRKGGFGEEDIYVSRLVNKQYTKPENLGPAINSKESEYDPCISANEDFIIFTSSGRGDSFGAGDLYGSKLVNKKWLPAVNLGKTFNTKVREYCSYLTPDSKYFFYSSGGNIKWISAEAVKKIISAM